jgi:hypothetical protein
MLLPDVLRARLRVAWERNRGDWLNGGGSWPRSFSTEPPTEEGARDRWDVFGEWLRQWRMVADEGAGHVRMVLRDWSRLGQQHVPEAWSFDSASAVAMELGQAARWQLAQVRFLALGDWSDTDAWRHTLARDFDLLADLSEPDFVRLRSVVDWLLHQPASGLYLRQLPIAGLDTKWAGAYRAVITRWLIALRGAEKGDFYTVTGLRNAPDTLRMRLLDDHLRSQLGGLSDLQAPITDIARLQLLQVRHVLIVENLYTCLSMDDLPGTVLFMGQGNAIEAYAQLPWLAGLPVSYWGDLDVHGFAILSRLRTYLPQARSLLMDAETLHAFKAFWVQGVSYTAEALPHLTNNEQQLYVELRDDRHGLRVRLEQERIAWDWAWARLAQHLR